MERRLVTIREVHDIRPIEGADAIECLEIDGWKVVAKKGEFNAGDLCIYFEIDSFLPIRPEFEFLRKSSYKNHPTMGEGFRLRTVKLRGQISQGLALPVQAFFGGPEAGTPLGMEVTELLGVRKYEVPVPIEMAGQVAGPFPEFIQKTDQERAQNLVVEIDEHYNDEFEVTMKLDGTSITVFVNNGEVGVCQRNYQMKLNDENANNVYVRTATQSGLLGALQILGRNLAIQCELMGPGIQGNREKFADHRMYVFDVYDIDKQAYLKAPARQKVIADLEKAHNVTIYHVPVIEAGAKLRSTGIEDLLVLADGESINHPIREGLVYKSITDPSFSFKTISNKFLLKCED